MSEYYYKLIPTIPDYVPDAAAREQARERFASFVIDAQQVHAQVSKHIEFISAMGNFDAVSCPTCGTMLNAEWWTRAMDAAYGESGVVDLRVTVPCCGTATSLNDLHYDFPQGFACFVLSAFEPNISDLEDWQMRELEGLLGCTLRKIWVHV